MKRVLCGLLLISLTLLLSRCGVRVKYTDREDFKKENEKERKELYKDVLSSVGVDSADKFSLMYIDYIMTESDRFKTLEKLNPTDNFSKFFLEAIPILYYSYSPATYKAVPKEWKDKTSSYILERNPYPFDSGEKKYRKWLEKQIKDENWFAFPFYDKKDPEVNAKGAKDHENAYKIIATFAWKEDFSYSEFKSLNKSSQASLISTSALMNFINNGNKLNDANKETFEKVEKRWIRRADSFLQNPRFIALDGNAPFTDVSEIAIDLIVNSD